jgi:hypothetical protein
LVFITNLKNITQIKTFGISISITILDISETLIISAFHILRY